MASCPGGHVEQLQLTGSNDIDATGAGGDEIITANNRKTVLNGMAGPDLLNGGRGNDSLSGGDGADTFDMTRSTGRDIILDYIDETDRIDLRNVRLNPGFDDLMANPSRPGTVPRSSPPAATSSCLSTSRRTRSTRGDFIFADLM